MKYFDYIYYRIARVFYKWDGAFGARAKGIISLLGAAVICYPILTLVVTLIRRPGTFSQSEKDILLNVGLACLTVITICSYIRYGEKRFRSLQDRYSHEDPTRKKIYGWMIIIFLFVVIFYAPILLMLMGAKLGYNVRQ